MPIEQPKIPSEEKGESKFIVTLEKFLKAKKAALELPTPQEQMEALKKAVDEYLQDIEEYPQKTEQEEK